MATVRRWPVCARTRYPSHRPSSTDDWYRPICSMLVFAIVAQRQRRQGGKQTLGSYSFGLMRTEPILSRGGEHSRPCPGQGRGAGVTGGATGPIDPARVSSKSRSRLPFPTSIVGGAVRSCFFPAVSHNRIDVPVQTNRASDVLPLTLSKQSGMIKKNLCIGRRNFVWSLGWQETVFIFVLALLVFGPKKLPGAWKDIGKALTEFRRASSELQSTWDREMTNLERETESLKKSPTTFQNRR